MSGLIVVILFFFAQHYSDGLLHVFLLKYGERGQGIITDTYTLGGGRSIQSYAVLSYECPPRQERMAHIPIGSENAPIGVPVQIHYSTYHCGWVTLDNDYGQSIPRVAVIGIILLGLFAGGLMIIRESRNKSYLEL